jgi:excinuclease UvrABC nuclease subunit
MKKSGYNISEWNKVRLNDLQSPSARKSLPATSGVYVVFYKVKGTRIRRLGAEDKQKVFYIGQTKNTRKRLHDFCKDVARLRRGIRLIMVFT